MRLLLVCVGILLGQSGWANFRITSPDKTLSITFSVDEEGIYYRVTRGEETVARLSPIVIQAADGFLTRGLTVVDAWFDSVATSYAMPFGKRKNFAFKANTVKLLMRDSSGGRQVWIEGIAADDGVAFRAFVAREGMMVVVDEKTAFGLPENHPPYVQWWDKAYEGFYEPRTRQALEEGKVMLFPLLQQTHADTWCLLTEAAGGCNYPGTQLTYRGGIPVTHLPESFTVADTLRTPWRVLIIGSLRRIVESSLVNDLSPPSRIVDMGWIKPGVVTFPWWADHDVSSDEKSLRRYVDLAAEMGWAWVEFDVALVGTNYHTSAEWKNTEWIGGFVDYARGKGVRVYGWDEYKALDTPAKRKDVFEAYCRLGIDGIKIDFLDSDSRDMMCFREAVLRDAARYRLMVSFHGESLPRGLQRTWPHLMTHEAVRGAEYYTFEGYPTPNAVHNTTLPFTRNVVGSMDYTPAVFSAANRETTDGHELALPFVFESGWMVLADAPEHYLRSAARPLLERLEVAWDETRLLDGYPGEYVVMARRKKSTWFIAAINAGGRRTVTIDVAPLRPSKKEVIMYADNAGGNDVVATRERVDNGKLSFRLLRNGGAVGMLETREGQDETRVLLEQD